MKNRFQRLQGFRIVDIRVREFGTKSQICDTGCAGSSRCAVLLEGSFCSTRNVSPGITRAAG
jgi:hypothetical protein